MSPRLLWLLLSLAACVDTPPPASCDVDRDGFEQSECAPGGPVDCRDDERTIYPGAPEICGDGVDDDCSGADLSCDDAMATLQVTLRGPLVEIGSDFFALTLDASRGHAISRLTIDGGDNLLFVGRSPLQLMGVSYWQRWYSVDPNAPAALDVELHGPLVVRWRVEWSDGDDAANNGLEGTSIYTLYPDGRLHRDELVEVLLAPPDADSAWLSMYVSVEPDRISHADFQWNDAAPYVVSDTGASDSFAMADINQLGYLCLYDQDGRERIGWLAEHAGGPQARGPRGRETAYGGEQSHQVSLHWDWSRGELTPVGSYRGNAVVIVGKGPTSGEPCAGLELYEAVLQAAPVLEVTPPATLDTTLPGDDDGDGFCEGGGHYALDAVGGTYLELRMPATAATAPSMALRITGLGATPPLAVSLNGRLLENGRELLWQVETDAAWLFIDHTFGPGDRIEVTGASR